MTPRKHPDFAAVAAEAEHMLTLSRAAPTDAAIVAGPHSLETMVTLCRHGFEHVVCAGGAGVCAGAGESGDILFIGGPVKDVMLAGLIRNAAALLAEEGALVAHLTDLDQDRLVEAALAQAGLTVCSTVFDLSTDVFVTHRLRRSDWRAEPIHAFPVQPFEEARRAA